MNPLLSKLQPYPFERLRALTKGITPNPALRPISLGIGEPKHPTPSFIKQALVDAVPQGQLQVIAPARHLLPMEQPRALNDALAAWLSCHKSA